VFHLGVPLQGPVCELPRCGARPVNPRVAAVREPLLDLFPSSAVQPRGGLVQISERRPNTRFRTPTRTAGRPVADSAAAAGFSLAVVRMLSLVMTERSTPGGSAFAAAPLWGSPKSLTLWGLSGRAEIGRRRGGLPGDARDVFRGAVRQH